MFKKDGIILNNEFISLTDIIKECYTARIKEEDLCLLKIEWKSTRSFDGATEILLVSRKDAKDFKKLITGLKIYFGEIAGKHSEVYGNLQKDDITIIDELEKTLHWLLDNPKGHNYNHSFLYNLKYELEDYNHDVSETRKNKIFTLLDKYL
jgi:hypothetical protein